jgi:nitrogen fixation/metabolism regulation signal transduction histidine kinase
MPKRNTERRKQMVVNRPLQGRLVLNMALLPAIALAGIAAFTGIYCYRLMDQAIATDTELPALMPLFYLVIVFELLAAIFLMVNSLKISHRVAGPAYRLVKSMQRMRTGDLAFSVQLRRGDHLTELRDELNKLIDWLNDNPPPGCITRSQAARADLERLAAAEAAMAESDTTAVATGPTGEFDADFDADGDATAPPDTR